jgi:hypothetical protein
MTFRTGGFAAPYAVKDALRLRERCPQPSALAFVQAG